MTAARDALSELHVYRNDVIDWVIASSPEDADAVCREHTGDNDLDDPHDWRPLPDDKVLAINLEDEGHTEMTCAEWIVKQGRGFLASTEY